jgi:hypothetical protein
MNKEKAISYLGMAVPIMALTVERFAEFDEAIRMAAQALEEPHWIPCSERLPKEGYSVLITREPFKIKGYEQEVIKAKRSVDPRSGEIEWWSPEFGTLTNKAVLAWMPLPEPWKEGDAE